MRVRLIAIICGIVLIKWQSHQIHCICDRDTIVSSGPSKCDHRHWWYHYHTDSSKCVCACVCHRFFFFSPNTQHMRTEYTAVYTMRQRNGEWVSERKRMRARKMWVLTFSCVFHLPTNQNYMHNAPYKICVYCIYVRIARKTWDDSYRWSAKAPGNDKLLGCWRFKGLRLPYNIPAIYISKSDQINAMQTHAF